MTPRTTLRRALALVVGLGILLPTSASAVSRPAVAHAASKDRVTFGIGPGGQAYVDRRSFVSYSAPPGGQLLDRVAVYNQSNQALDLLVYASDAQNTKTGALEISTRSQQNHETGAWILLGQAAETGALARDARSMLRVHVPAQSAEHGIGRVVIPMRVMVPTDATPGDHVAGVVVSLISKGSNPTSQNIELEQRVALRAFVQVSGELRPRLAVKILKATYLGGSGLGLHGTTRVTYQIRNTGNVRLGAVPTVSSRGPFGLGTWSAKGAEVDELLPGGAALQTTDVRGPWPTVVQHASVDVTAKAVLGARLARIPTAHDSVRVWAITWQEVVAVVLLLLWFLYWRRRTTQPPRQRGKHVRPGPDQPERVKAAAGAVGLVVAVAALLVGIGPKAHAADLGPIQVSPQSGTDATLFTGWVEDTRCPRGTADSYWSVDGPDLPHDQAILAPGNRTGTGSQVFRGASIANLKTTNSGAFSRSGTYVIRFSCVRSPDGRVTSSYQAELRYTAGGKGAFRVIGAKPVPVYVLDPQQSPKPQEVAPTPGSSASPGASAVPGGAGAPSPSATATRAADLPDTSPLATQEQGGAVGWWVALLGVIPLGLGAWVLKRRT